MAEAPRRRFRLRDLSPRWCRAKACPRLIFPEPVRLNRFAAARFVFIFGIFAPYGFVVGCFGAPAVAFCFARPAADGCFTELPDDGCFAEPAADVCFVEPAMPAGFFSGARPANGRGTIRSTRLRPSIRAGISTCPT